MGTRNRKDGTMSPRQRAQVVVLLRCAADFSRTGWGWPPPICEADAALGGTGSINRPGPLAVIAMQAAADVIGGYAVGCAGDSHAIADVCLEAAQRVEDGWTPTTLRDGEGGR